MDTAIFQPVLALIALTFVVGFIMLGMRIHAVAKGLVSEKYFLLVNGDAPEHLIRVSNNLNNLVALPVVFYVMCIIAYITEQVGENFILYAWIFFGSRVAHSIIHIGYNYLPLRMLAFLVGLAVLIVMLAHLFISLYL